MNFVHMHFTHPFLLFFCMSVSDCRIYCTFKIKTHEKQLEEEKYRKFVYTRNEAYFLSRARKTLF